MEIWDLYDVNRNLTGATMTRSYHIPKDCYHLVVDAIYLNRKGEILLQQRSHEKATMPDVWSIIGGSAISGETSADACIRETREEMGFCPDLSNGRVILTITNDQHHYIRDVFLIQHDIEPCALHLQADEVQDACWMLPEDIEGNKAFRKDLSRLSYWDEVLPTVLSESQRIRKLHE